LPAQTKECRPELQRRSWVFSAFLGMSVSHAVQESSQSATTPKSPALLALPAPEPLATNLTTFWKGAGMPGDLFGEVLSPAIDAPRPKRLGAIPFWRADTRFLDAVEPFYKRASEKGIKIFIGDTGIATD
jgi:hypothetical protein